MPTVIRLQAGWIYLMAVIDCYSFYSRFVVSWSLDQTLAVDFVLKAVDQALQISKPEILNSVQGSHFTNPQYVSRLEDHQIKISMECRRRVLDNVFTERL